MTSPAEPGETGRKARGGAASSATAPDEAAMAAAAAATADVTGETARGAEPPMVPGAAEIRVARADTQILRDGVPYGAGEPVPVDFAAYTELAGIGAIVKDRWADLPRVGGA